MDPYQSQNQSQDAWDANSKSKLLESAAMPEGYPAVVGYPSTSGYQSPPGAPQGLYMQGPGYSAVNVQPAITVSSPPLGQPKPEYLCYSIFTMVCCCFPLGLAALVYSIHTQTANMIGQQQIAERNSRTARKLNHAALGCGLAFLVLVVIVAVVNCSYRI